MTRETYKLIFMFALCSFLTPFIGSSINLALPIIGAEFGMNIVNLGWVATIFLLTTSVFLIPMGRVADLVGRKKIFMSGIVIFTLASFACSIASSGAFLMGTRIIQGIGSAMIFSTAMAILVTAVPQNRRGSALGLTTAGVYLGNSLGPVLGGIITQSLGWRYIFATAATLGTIVAFLARYNLNGSHDHAHAQGERFDFMGTLLYAAAVSSMLYGTTRLPSSTGYVLIATGIITLILFCIVENLIQQPVFDVRLLLKNKRFALANMAALLNFCASFAVPFCLSMYLQFNSVLSPRQAGMILIIAALGMILFSPISGRLADKKDTRILAALGMGCTAFSLFALSIILSPTTPQVAIAACLFVFGVGLSLFANPNTHAAMEAVSPRHSGLAAALLNTMRTFGQTMSMGISMMVFSLVVGTVSISSDVVPQLIQGIKIIFLIFGIFCIVGIFASLARDKGPVAGKKKIEPSR